MTSQELVFAVLVKEAMSRNMVKEAMKHTDKRSDPQARSRAAGHTERRSTGGGAPEKPNFTPKASREASSKASKAASKAGRVLEHADRTTRAVKAQQGGAKAGRFAAKHGGKAVGAALAYGAYRGAKSIYKRLKAAKAAKRAA